MRRTPIRLSIREIVQKDLEHSKLVFITGKPGSGKTGLLIVIASLLTQYEVCIWRGLRGIHGHEFRFPGKVNIVGYQCDPKFWDGAGRPIKAKVRVVNDFETLLRKCELERLNVIYMPPIDERKHWINFAGFLGQRIPYNYASPYISLFIDEVEDLLPEARTPGVSKEVTAFLSQMKEFRNFIISMYCATQQPSDVDYGARGKMQYRIFLQGANVPRKSRVRQRLVDKLKIGEGIVSGSLFGGFKFPNYPRRKIVVVK